MKFPCSPLAREKFFSCFIFLLIVAKNGERILGPTISFCFIIDMCMIIWIWIIIIGSCLLHIKLVPWWWQTFKSSMLDLSKVDCQLIVGLHGSGNSKSNNKYYLKPRFFKWFWRGVSVSSDRRGSWSPCRTSKSSKDEWTWSPGRVHNPGKPCTPLSSGIWCKVETLSRRVTQQCCVDGEPLCLCNCCNCTTSNRSSHKIKHS